ncbi:hypothetical protein [Tissierella sp.]|uniref:hypothetical protein n=1 Tax=Tissierella sp. TaxID=41274 RepID=UPI0028622368|nr:hypothetical protein [Tissierella sp.]MDR7857894.1 hypothetical protein [Tissierella sp.]
MKKMILGASMLLSGVIGFVGLMIASVNKVQPGSISTVIGCMRGTDYFFAAIFIILAIIGLFIEIVEVKR